MIKQKKKENNNNKYNYNLLYEYLMLFNMIFLSRFFGKQHFYVILFWSKIFIKIIIKIDKQQAFH